VDHRSRRPSLRRAADRRTEWAGRNCIAATVCANPADVQGQRELDLLSCDA
jgi:hypothetical protein